MLNNCKKEKLHQASRKIVAEALEKFLTDGGEIFGFEDFHDRDIGITEEQTKKFLDFMERPRKHPYIDPKKDPREPAYVKNEKGIFTIEYFVENTIYIWNVDHAEYE